MMNTPPTLSEIQAQLEAQDAELADLEDLAKRLPDGAFDLSLLVQIDEATELPPLVDDKRGQSSSLSLFYIRA